MEASATQFQTIDEITRTWAGRCVESFLCESAEVIRLPRLVVPKGNRSQGFGSGFMADLIAHADRVSKPVVLSPSTDFGASSVVRLTRFYQRFGFVENHGKKRDFRFTETMIREPKASG